MVKSKYETNVVPRLSEIKSWRKEGAKYKWIAKKLGIGFSTFYRYMNENEELMEVLRNAEQCLYDKIVLTAEDTILKKLQDRYELSEELIEQWTDEKGKVIKQHKTMKKKLILADTTAIIFALKAHKGEVWNADEKKINDKRIDLLDIKTKNLEKPNDIAVFIGERLNNYLGDGDNNDH